MHPDTSLAAYKAVSSEMLLDHHSKIVDALKVLKEAIMEEVASYIGWDDKNKASRRFKELESNQVIYKTGKKKLTKSGRNANVYALVTNGEKSVEAEVIRKDTTTAADYANMLIAQRSQLKQQELFQ